MIFHDKYKFREYDKKYPELFKRENAKLKKILGKHIEIHHIGSTAIPNLGGKGIIDIMISPKRDIIKVKKKLEKAGYIFKESGGGENRLFFKRTYTYMKKTRMVHLQLIFFGTDEYHNHLKFKDKLLQDKKFTKRYEAIKKKAIKISKGEGKIYREYKEKKFFEKIKGSSTTNTDSESMIKNIQN